MKPASSRPLSALPRLVRRHRRVLAALLTFVAVFGTLTALAPPEPARVPVVVAARALPGGTTLETTHLETRHVTADAVPVDAAADPSPLVGRTLAGPVSQGSILTGASVADDERLARPGHVIVSLRLPDPSLAALARPGARLDLWDAAGAAVASDVPIVPSPTPASGGFDASAAGATVLLEVTPEVATRLATLPPGDLTVAVR